MIYGFVTVALLDKFPLVKASDFNWQHATASASDLSLRAVEKGFHDEGNQGVCHLTDMRVLTVIEGACHLNGRCIDIVCDKHDENIGVYSSSSSASIPLYTMGKPLSLQVTSCITAVSQRIDGAHFYLNNCIFSQLCGGKQDSQADVAYRTVPCGTIEEEHEGIQPGGQYLLSSRKLLGMAQGHATLQQPQQKTGLDIYVGKLSEGWTDDSHNAQRLGYFTAGAKGGLARCHFVQKDGFLSFTGPLSSFTRRTKLEFWVFQGVAATPQLTVNIASFEGTKCTAVPLSGLVSQKERHGWTQFYVSLDAFSDEAGATWEGCNHTLHAEDITTIYFSNAITAEQLLCMDVLRLS